MGCQSKKKPAEPRAFPIEVAPSIQSDIPFYLKGIGQLKANYEVDIKSQVDGILTDVLIDSGQRVSKGELLMVIDQRPYIAALMEAKAQLQEDKARLKYALEFAEAYGALVGEEYVARLEYEEGVQNVGVYQAAIDADLAEIKKAEINLGYTEIRAPWDGYLGLRIYDPGNFISVEANETLITLRVIHPILISFSVPGEHVDEIRHFQNEEGPLLVDAFFPGQKEPIQGSLYFIDNTVDPDTGMIHLQGTYLNEDERGWPGAFVRVRMKLKTLFGVILVPSQALVLTETGYIVFVLKEDGTVEQRAVQKGEVYKGMTMVEGIKAGEKVVIDGQVNLYDGARVFIPKSKESKGAS